MESFLPSQKKVRGAFPSVTDPFKYKEMLLILFPKVLL